MYVFVWDGSWLDVGELAKLSVIGGSRISEQSVRNSYAFHWLPIIP